MGLHTIDEIDVSYELKDLRSGTIKILKWMKEKDILDKLWDAHRETPFASLPLTDEKESLTDEMSEVFTSD